MVDRIVSIVCPGPSMPWALKAHGVTHCHIAVNRAIEQVDCDWYSAGDYISFGTAHRPAVGVVTQHLVKRQVEDPRRHWSPLAWSTWEDIVADPFTPIQFSFEAAIYHAVKVMGATRIVAYGADLEGGTYADESPVIDQTGETKAQAKERVEAWAMIRWANERSNLARALRWARKQGVRWRRVTRPVNATMPNAGEAAQAEGQDMPQTLAGGHP